MLLMASRSSRLKSDTDPKPARAKDHESQPAPIRLCLVHERVLFRESLGRLLAAERGFELVIECASHAEALETLNESLVDVVLLGLSGEGGENFISAARQAGYPGKFLIVTSTIDGGSLALALKLGASGIFLESSSSARLIQVIRLVARGEVWVDQSLIRLLVDRYPQSDELRVRLTGLTDRQGTVVQGVVDGLSNRKIADRLGVSEGTVKGTLQQLFAKVGVRTRSQLVRAALEGVLGSDAETAKHEPVQS
jgi:DNA-binding NarL/FixJ family response regulator